MARIVVAMSGGVDSSVAAALLKEQGHEVIGIMLRLWSEPAAELDDGVEHVAENKCCSLESVGDARRVSQLLDINFYMVNVEQQFKQRIVDYFYDEYVQGRTPNPCLNCNRHIRFTLLLERALALGAEYLATGHYVRVETDPVSGKRRLRKGVDPAKDQSYVLHVLNQQQLAHACFPLGGFTKPEVRAMAAERGLPVAAKAESQEICFVAGGDYRGFMKRYTESTGAKAPSQGPILDVSGQQIGTHQGLAYYTVGQRRGLGLDLQERLHVLKLDTARNALVVGGPKHLERDTFTVHQAHYISGEVPSEPFEANVRVRYKASEIPAVITPLSATTAQITLSQPQRAITPGQAAVFYGGPTEDEVLGGGIIRDD
ncbi:MAG TPA: tRNA 2-thiouridine(34) synthase MnmA [Ktedonobacterales bacterium]